MTRRRIYSLTNSLGAIVKNGIDMGTVADTIVHSKMNTGPCTAGTSCKVPPCSPSPSPSPSISPPSICHPSPSRVIVYSTPPLTPTYPSREFWFAYWQRKRQQGWKSKKEQKADQWKAAIEKKALSNQSGMK